jgi:plastocyanin
MTVARRLVLVAGILAAHAVTTAPVLAAGAAVSIVGTSFQPSTITVHVGDTVTWTVTQSIGQPHSVTSGTPQDSGKVFDSGTAGENSSFKLRDNGQTFEYTFKQAGEFPYYCVIHPTQMTGKVVVVAEGASPPPSVQPPLTEQKTGVPAERRLLAGSILVIALVVMFAGAWLWRRMNPA